MLDIIISDIYFTYLLRLSKFAKHYQLISNDKTHKKIQRRFSEFY